MSNVVPQSVMIAGPAGTIEALIEAPAETAQVPLVAVICHPHPLFGGTVHNKVVHTLARALQAGGAATVRFNFRGVGASQGTHDNGLGETADTLCAVAWARVRWPHAPLVLAGFSFGAAVAIRAAAGASPVWLISVAPAVDRVALEGAAMPSCDWLIVQGDADDVVQPQSVLTWAARHAPQARVRVLAGVGHFFHGHLHELRDCLAAEWPVGVIRRRASAATTA